MTRAVFFVSRHFIGFSVLAYLVGAGERIAEAIAHDGPIRELRLNNLTQYFVNYPDHGFARRALVGTVLRPLTDGTDAPELAVFWLSKSASVPVLNAGQSTSAMYSGAAHQHRSTGYLPPVLVIRL